MEYALSDKEIKKRFKISQVIGLSQKFFFLHIHYCLVFALYGFVAIFLISVIDIFAAGFLDMIPFLDGSSAFARFAEEMVFTSFKNMLPILLIQSVTVYAVLQFLKGETFSLKKSFSVGFKRFLPLLALIFLTSFIISIGFMFFLIPGVILWGMLYVAIPVFINEEKTPINALKRSSALVGHCRGKVQIIELILFIVFYAFMYVVSFLIKDVAFLNSILADFIIHYLYCVFHVLIAVSASVIYYQLRIVREGLQLDDALKAFE